jgi:5-methylcytosine-specific restriction endonuclease McrA
MFPVRSVTYVAGPYPAFFLDRISGESVAALGGEAKRGARGTLVTRSERFGSSTTRVVFAWSIAGERAAASSPKPGCSAFRRVAAARIVRRFPALLDAVASGELHLTGVLLLGPHLTESNLVEVLSRAKYRTKREILRLVRILDPLPAVPPRIEPLGPAPAPATPAGVVSAAPSWEEFVQATCPVRELAPGERPRDWMQGAEEPGVASLDDWEGTVDSTAFASNAALARMKSTRFASDAALSRVGATVPQPLAPERYKVQFTATEEYVRLVDEAKALLSHAASQLTLEELQLHAMRTLVAELKKKKYATLDHPPARRFAPQAAGAAPETKARIGRTQLLRHGSQRAVPLGRVTEQTSPSGHRPDQATSPNQRPDHESSRSRRSEHASTPSRRSERTSPRQRGRHIPAAVRRAVFERDGSQCSYVAATGERCIETQRLEFHHLKPFGAGGAHTTSNLTLRCRAHNALAAEEDFGREFIEILKPLRD